MPPLHMAILNPILLEEYIRLWGQGQMWGAKASLRGFYVCLLWKLLDTMVVIPEQANVRQKIADPTCCALQCPTHALVQARLPELGKSLFYKMCLFHKRWQKLQVTAVPGAWCHALSRFQESGSDNTLRHIVSFILHYWLSMLIVIIPPFYR